ncbi:Type II secretion system protein C [Zhongshania aliphaticivorans]|uniref:Type II secretion system protein C n=1 Tax=Zhongshania aliphaticivorans TaxID=1470434 RepID=A0A5S9NB31_9GAMM|nr:hypothetical protein [Zhongshania aliphaticivorans]CAA0087203.1 Type II secretion system protein C [Zhongshania aliphaticivorans]CAA0114270.1 Type II secretion system protein C [Zhongshania aliphaticivorans]
MVSSIVRGVVFSAITGLILFTAGSMWPVMRATSEEALIFNAENADMFGEDPYVYTELRLQELGPDYALMTVDGDNRQLQPGDMLVEPCLSLSRILKNAVLLDHCGSYALLSLRQPTHDASTLKLQVLNSIAELPLGREPKVVDLRGNERIQQLVSDYRHRLYDRPLSLLGAINVDVVRSAIGREYYISPGKDKRIFSQLGLEPGDRVRAFDGISMTDDEAVTAMYERLDDVNHLAITLERNQQDWVVLVDFDTLALNNE